MASSLIHVAVVAAIGYALLLLVVFWNQDSLLYIPGDRTIRAVPSDIGLNYEEVKFAGSDQVSIHGWFVTVDNPRGVVLFCHGNAGNISHRLDSLKLFARLGFSILIFDYRGYGRSEGKPTEAGTYRDVRAAYTYLLEKHLIKPEQIVLFGRSVGAGVATHLASRQQCGALIMESGFTSVPDLAQQLYPFLPVRLLTRFSYNSKEILKEIDCPVLVAHSQDDEIIPFSHGRQLFEAAGEPKHFLRMRGGHNDGFYVTGESYFNGLDQFLTEALSGGE